MLSVLTPEYLIASLVVVLLPGAGVIYTLSHGLFLSGRHSIWAAFGCTLGILPHILASGLGLAAVLHASALAFQLVKYAGVAYLVYLAWGMWRSSGAIAVDASGVCETTAARIVIRGLLLNSLNPKLSVFFLAFLPQFMPPFAPSALEPMIVLSAAFMLMTLAVFVAYGLAAGLLRDKVLSSEVFMRWLQRSFATAFAGFAIKLAASER